MTVGIIGAGQLGRMLALAGYPLGLDFLFLDRDGRTPGGQVAPTLTGEFTDGARLAELARRSQIITFDWENVPVEPLRALGRAVHIAPPLAALATAQDRLAEKQLFAKLGIPTTRHAAIESRAELLQAATRIGIPGVLKTRRMGYDGKGQYVVRSSDDLDAAWSALGAAPLLYEELVRFDFEVSIIGARSTQGEIAVYPLARNLHAAGILISTQAPCGPPRLATTAGRHLRRLLEHFRYSGVLTVEFFVRRGRLLANEMAPRVHNSGHWTIEGAVTSQFENHLRAILGMPLGATDARGHAGMLNFIGNLPDRPLLLALPGVHWHDYGKTPRPGRKLGHCTVIARSARQRDAVFRKAQRLVGVPNASHFPRRRLT